MKEHFEKHWLTYMILIAVLAFIISITGFVTHWNIKENDCDEYKNGICKTIMMDGRECYTIESYDSTAIWCDSNLYLDEPSDNPMY